MGFGRTSGIVFEGCLQAELVRFLVIDMNLRGIEPKDLRDLVDRLYVLATGLVIAEGHPSLLDTHAEVSEVFLGTPPTLSGTG